MALGAYPRGRRVAGAPEGAGTCPTALPLTHIEAPQRRIVPSTMRSIPGRWTSRHRCTGNLAAWAVLQPYLLDLGQGALLAR